MNSRGACHIARREGGKYVALPVFRGEVTYWSRFLTGESPGAATVRIVPPDRVHTEEQLNDSATSLVSIARLLPLVKL